MKLTHQELRFVERRRKLVRLWPWAATFNVLLLLGLVIWLRLSHRLLIDPWYVFARLEADAIPETTLTVMAGLTPVAMLTCLVVVAACIILSFSVFWNERKHIAIIRRLAEEVAGPGGDDSKE